MYMEHFLELLRTFFTYNEVKEKVVLAFGTFRNTFWILLGHVGTLRNLKFKKVFKIFKKCLKKF